MKKWLITIVFSVLFAVGFSLTALSILGGKELVVLLADRYISRRAIMGADIRMFVDSDRHPSVDKVNIGYTIKYLVGNELISVTPFVGSYLGINTCRCYQENHKYFVGRAGGELNLKLTDMLGFTLTYNALVRDINNSDSYKQEVTGGLRVYLK